MTLNQVAPGNSFQVKRVSLGGEIGKRLADMGFVAGVHGKVVRSALAGDPVQIEILGYQISIRISEAAGVEVDAENQTARGPHRHRHGQKSEGGNA